MATIIHAPNDDNLFIQEDDDGIPCIVTDVKMYYMDRDWCDMYKDFYDENDDLTFI